MTLQWHLRFSSGGDGYFILMCNVIWFDASLLIRRSVLPFGRVSDHKVTINNITFKHILYTVLSSSFVVLTSSCFKMFLSLTNSIILTFSDIYLTHSLPGYSSICAEYFSDSQKHHIYAYVLG